MNTSRCNVNDTNYPFFDCSETLTDRIITRYVIQIVQIASLMYTIVCIFIFWKIIKHEQHYTRNGNMFNYLFLKSIFEFLSIITEMSDIISSLSSFKTLQYRYIWLIIDIWIFHYLNSVVIIISMYIEVLVTFDCYLVINNFLNSFKSKKSLFINITVLVIVSLCINIIYLFLYDIVEIEGDLNNSYKLISTCFSLSKYFIIISNLVLILRDFLPNVLLLIINSLIVLTLKRIHNQKKTLNVNSSEIYRAKIDKIKMIIAVSISLIIGRVPFIIYAMPIHGYNFFWNCTFYPFSILLYFVPYILQIVFYYRFNKIFQKYLKF
jgi:hypothetical protein